MTSGNGTTAPAQLLDAGSLPSAVRAAWLATAPDLSWLGACLVATSMQGTAQTCAKPPHLPVLWSYPADMMCDKQGRFLSHVTSA